MGETTAQVKLLDYPKDPLAVLYVAYRTCYSSESPQELRRKVDDGTIPREKVLAFLDRWLPLGHGSPRQQLNFTFAVSGMSRAASHQFVRHHVGIVFDQQSQRYVEFKDESDFPYVLPASWAKAELTLAYANLMLEVQHAYRRAIEAGVPAEDARFVLPNATATNLQFTVNFEEVLHIADERLCTRAQWEIRHIWAKVRAEIGRACPDLKQYIQPKCGSFRLGYCDETFKDYQACPLSRVRPHKSAVLVSAPRGAMEDG